MIEPGKPDHVSSGVIHGLKQKTRFGPHVRDYLNVSIIRCTVRARSKLAHRVLLCDNAHEVKDVDEGGVDGQERRADGYFD